MKLIKALEILKGIDYELSIISNGTSKQCDKAWDRLKKASEEVINEIESNLQE